VALIGTPAYRLDGATPGHYFSVLVARRSNPPESLAGLQHMRLAFNMAQSQSGFAAPVRLLAAMAASRCLSRSRQGRTALPCRRWPQAKPIGPQLTPSPGSSPSGMSRRRHDLVVFARTPETPALPLITSLRLAGQAPRIADAIDIALKRLDQRSQNRCAVGPDQVKPAGLRAACSTSAGPGCPAGLQAEMSQCPVALSAR
jgi:ABC-type phosphate/phosphonate transport system substrate-binding protein